MPIKPVSGKIEAQIINDNLSYLESEIQKEKSGAAITDNSIPSIKLKVSSDSDRIKLINLSDEVLGAMAGTTPVNATPGVGSVTEEKFSTGAVSTRALANKSVIGEKVLEKSIDLNNISVPLAYMTPSKNLIDKTKLKTGHYISYTSGIETPNTGYNATEFIRIKPSTVYSINTHDQTAFFDINKVYISGLGGNGGFKNTYTTPANGAYIRISVANANVDKVQLEENPYPTLYEPFKVPKPIDDVIAKDRVTDLLSHMENPFKKTKLKIIGDSITAGVGGTGYSKTGEFMFTDHNGAAQYANLETATSWANSLKKLLEKKYNGLYEWVDLSHPEIKIGSYDAVFEKREYVAPGYQWRFKNLTAGNTMMKFTFYGDRFTVKYATSTIYGIFDIYVDGVLVQTIDGYAPTFIDQVTTEITGLSLDYHTVEFKETNTKNASATIKDVMIEGLRIPKTVVVKNWGISGWMSKHLEFNPAWVSSDDDFILMQLGTNDRQVDGMATYTYQSNFVRKMRSQGRKVILMASIPAAPSNDNRTDVPYYRNMEDVASDVRAVAHDLEVPFISNHEFFNRYLLYTGVNIDSLLSDGLHPNDAGYDLMYRNIVQELGFGLPADGINW